MTTPTDADTDQTNDSPPARPGERALRVGVMLNSLIVPAWVAKILRQIGEAPFAEISLIVLNVEPDPPQARFARLRGARRRALLFNLYSRVDERLFRSEPNAFAPVDTSAQLGSVPHLDVDPLRPRPFEHRFSPEAVDRIREADLDVLLRFGFNIIRGDILQSARYGVWSFHHGDNRHYRGQPDFFWEMAEGNPVTGTMLQVLTDELDAGRILQRSFAATDATSLHRGRNAAYWKSAEFVIRSLGDLHSRGWSELRSTPEYNERQAYRRAIYRTPTNAQMVAFLTRLAPRTAWRQFRKHLFSDTWHVAYRRRPAETVQVPPKLKRRSPLPVRGAGRLRRLPAAPGRYYADPFIVEHENRHYILFEDYDAQTAKGSISAARLDERGIAEPAVPVLETPYHLSYPFVFKSGGNWYMIPETRSHRDIELYRATDFPHRWTLERVLVDDVDAVDATILEHDGRFWLFANMVVRELENVDAAVADELFLFSAESLDGDWVPHPLNPVVSDVRRSRPAGRVIAHNGTLIRPSQDSSERYGKAVVFNRIDCLNTGDYVETPIGRLDADWRRGNLATHTFNTSGPYEVVDVKRRTWKLTTWARQKRG